MRVGEVAHLAAVSTKTLRYYESIGLIDPPLRSASGYRDFHPDVLGRLGFIRSAQALGLTLGEIRRIIALRDDGEAPCAHVLQLVQARVGEIEQTIEQLRDLQRELKRLTVRAAQLNPTECEPGRVCHLIGDVPVRGG